MFTGLVQALGVITRLTPQSPGLRIAITGLPNQDPLALGESIAVNGCCLTVASIQNDAFEVDLGPETLARTNLASLNLGTKVNLERALKPTDRLGGHFVQGHIDTTATLAERRQNGNWQFLRFHLEPRWTPLIVEKGSIAVDGVSLTIVDTPPSSFTVMLIPHTLAHTTLGLIQPGDHVNIECDLLAKHIERLLQFREIT
jgi:riboflavin synthase